MERLNFAKRFLCMVLALALMVGLLPAHVLHAHAHDSFVQFTQDENGNVVVNFTKVDNDKVTAGLTPNGQTEIKDEVTYADTDVVRASIILRKSSTIDAGYSAMDITTNKDALKYRESLKLDQANMVYQIEKAIQTDLDVVWRLTLAANMISVNVEYGQIEAIKKLPGVKDVVLENQYLPCQTEDGAIVPNMATSGNQIGTGPVWEAGYTGAGMRIAVIDTGIDTDHQSLNGTAFMYALEQLAIKKGISKEEYIASLDLLDAEEIASVADKLNVNIDPAQTYISGKIAFAYNYRDFDYDVTHDNDEEGDHGSHVAGIATANSWLYNATTGNYGKAMDYAFMQGVAPDAQLLAMKVFGKGGSPYDSDFFAAIEDAIILGADAINLSLGSTAPGRGHHSNAQFQQIMDSLTESGVVVAISAGNSGSWVENADNGGYLYNTDIGMNTTGQPGAFTNSMCVASVENDGMVGYYFTVNGETIVYIEEVMNDMKSLTTLAGQQEYIFIDGVGKEEDWAALADVLPGKVAICSRGETNFTEKARLATEAGAIAVMVYNNVSGIIYLDMTEFYGTQPVVSLTKKQGAIIRENSTPVYDNAGNLLYLTGTMNISDTIGKGEFASEYYTMSDFSSWGVPGSLEMKPEITAPGGNIFSIEGLNPNGGAYAIKSGTSMASPQVAGMAALMMQYIRENELDKKTGMDIRHLAQSLLMSTATPILAAKNNYYSILQQGAGLANINSAITADSYITMAAGSSSGAADGKVKVELFDDPDRNGSYSATFTLHNLNNADTTVELNADFFVQALLSDGEFLYMDTATTLIGMDVVWYVDGQAVIPALLVGMDFNGDGQVNMSDGQTLLDYTTGVSSNLSHKDKADVDGDGDIDSHDAYLFLRELVGITTTLKANDSIEVRVTFDIPDTLKDTLDADYPNGTYIQGFLFAETENTQHSIPVLGFYGNWTDASMFDVGSWPTYETGEDTRIPYTGILRGNEFQVRYAKDGSYHYTLGGNPLITDKVYMPERNSINSSNFIHGVRFTPIRHADQSRVIVVNESTGEVLLDKETGAVNMAYYPNEIYGWQNTLMSLETNFSLKNTSEDDVITMAFSLAPEYYVDANGNVAWDALGAGATRSIELVIDNSAPELKGISIDLLNNTMTITASDNQYIAAAGLYNKTGTRRLAAEGAKQDIEKGATAEYTFSLDGISGKKFLVQVHDYAMNTATYLIEMQIGEDAGVPDMMAFDLVSRHWTTFTNDFVYDYKVGTPRLEYSDHTFYAATIAEHYVFASTSRGELYVMPEDDLSDTNFVVNMGVILYDMAYNKADGNIYAVTDAGNLVMIDKLTGELTRIGAMPKRSNTLACSPEGVFYFNELGTGKIYSFTLETMNAPELLMEDPFLTRKDPVYGDHNGTEGNMGMEYDPNKDIICWNSHIEVLVGSSITFAYYYEINPDNGEFVRYNDFWHEMSCLMIPDLGGRDDSWAEPTTHVSGVAVNKSAINVIKGTSAKLVANVQPWTATDRDVTWSSANETIATVDENGIVTGVAPGTTTITATSKLDPTKSASCEVTVDLLHVTIEGTVMDKNSNTTFYSWNMATQNTWEPGKSLPFAPASVTWSPLSSIYYMMDTTDAQQMHKVDANGNILASADNENGIPLWDMVYSETFSAQNAEKVTSIYYCYLLSAKDPMALDAVGFDMGSMCSYLVGITSMGTEQIEDEDGVSHTSEHLIMLDNDGYIWDFWVYAREGGGFDAMYSITRSDLYLELPGYDSMEYMFCSLMVDDNGDLFLSAYTGETNELYYLTYDEIEEMYLAVKIGDMGDDVWPATITSVTLNNPNATNASHPTPSYTMSATTISREKLAAASGRVRFAVTEAEKNYKLGVKQDEQVGTHATGTSTDPFVLSVGSETFDVTTTGVYVTFTAPTAGTYTITMTPGEGLALRLNVNGVTTSVYEEPGQVELAAGETVVYQIRLYKEGGSKYVMQDGQVTVTITGEGGGTTPDPECQHTNLSDWQSDDDNHWKVCADCNEKVGETAHSYGDWANGKKSCECGKEISCQHPNTSDWVTDEQNHWKTCTDCGEKVSESTHSYQDGACECGKADPNATEPECQHTNLGEWQSDDDNHWKVCADCNEKVGETAHSYGDWANGKKSCECGKEIVCEHTNTGDWVTDEQNHWKTCTDCGEKVSEGAHSYQDYFCSCGKRDPSAPEDNLVLGDNTGLTTGETYTYTATEDGRLSLVFDMLKDSEGVRIYDYTYGQGNRVKVMVNGALVPHIADTSHDNETKITVRKGQTITVELVSVDGGEYTINLAIAKTEAAAQLQLGDNAIANKTEYSFIAPQSGTLYTTIKELWYDGTYCSEKSLESSVVFKINGVVVEKFKNAYEVEAGDEITVLMSANFYLPGSAVLNLSYEGFFEHAPGTRGNPYILNYADCPTNSVEIPAGTDVWYKLVGFPEGAYLTVEGANAYAYIGSSTTRINAVDGKLTVAAAVNMRIGNSGSAPAVVRFSVNITEGEQANPKDLVEGDNKVVLGTSENYYYDFVAKKPGTATFTVSGANWRFWYSFFGADGTAIVTEEEHQARREDSATITVDMTVGQSFVLKLATLNDSFTAPGGELTVTFYFTPDQSASDCEHTNTRQATENQSTPSCTVDGGYDTVTYCVDCGEELSRVHTTIPAEGHTPGAAATCTSAQLCTVCGQKVANSLGHNFVEGTCTRCGALEADNALVLGKNEGLTSGNVYTYTVTEDGGLSLIFENLKGSDGSAIYNYEYGKGLKVRILVNGVYVPQIKSPPQSNATKITVSAGQVVTVELESVDGGNYTVDVTVDEIEAPNALQLGDNEIAKKTDYSFIAPQDGTLYTTIKELWYDGSYCTEASLTSTLVFKINGVMVTEFKNAYEVKAGDEITFLLGLSFGDDSARAVLNLSYEGFYQHPAGSRGNPHVLNYSDCPTTSAQIPAGETAWYRLSGFGSGYYLTITGENAYAIVGTKFYYAEDGVVTVPAATEIQIGNSGTAAASFPIAAGITVGYPDNPKDLMEGDNIVSLPERGNYWYDFKATANGIATITMSGENWGYQYIVYGADGSVVSYSHETTLWYQCKGDPETVDVTLLAGQTLVVKVGTMTGSGSSLTSPGGTVNVNFHFVADGSCNHYSESGTWHSDDTHHWQICDFCEESFNKSTHSYGEDDQCVCGKTDPASQCEHEYGAWVDGKKICSKCGNTVTCRHFTTTVKNQKDPKCEEEGYTGDTHCSVCDKLIKSGTAIPATGHHYEEGTCTGCGAADPDYRPIIAQDVVSDVDVTNGVITITWNTAKMTLVGYDIHADYHSVVEGEGTITIGYISLETIPAGDAIATLYFEVADPDDVDTTVEHEQVNNELPGECLHKNVDDPVIENSKDATCTDAGSYESVVYCSDCKQEVSRETVSVPAAHNADHVERKEPTTNEPGNIEHWFCDACDKYFADADCTDEITHEETILQPTGIPGDADGDGFVDAYDASLVKKYSVGAIAADELELSVLDVDGDGFVDAYDASLIQKYSVGAIDKFPSED